MQSSHLKIIIYIKALLQQNRSLLSQAARSKTGIANAKKKKKANDVLYWISWTWVCKRERCLLGSAQLWGRRRLWADCISWRVQDTWAVKESWRMWACLAQEREDWRELYSLLADRKFLYRKGGGMWQEKKIGLIYNQEDLGKKNDRENFAGKKAFPRSDYWIHWVSFSCTWVLFMSHTCEPNLPNLKSTVVCIGFVGLLWTDLGFSIIMAMQLTCSPEDLLWCITWVHG